MHSRWRWRRRAKPATSCATTSTGRAGRAATATRPRPTSRPSTRSAPAAGRLPRLGLPGRGDRPRRRRRRERPSGSWTPTTAPATTWTAGAAARCRSACSREGRPVARRRLRIRLSRRPGRPLRLGRGRGPAHAATAARVSPALPRGLGPLDVVLVSSKGDRDPETNLRCTLPRATAPVTEHRAPPGPGGGGGGGGRHLALRARRLGLRGGPRAAARGRGAARGPGRAARSPTRRTARASARAPSAARAAVADAPGPRGLGLPGRLGRRERRARAPAAGRGQSPMRALLARAQGCLLGQIAGDSLGSLVEFQSAARGRDASTPRVRGCSPTAGTWDTLAGQATDDSEMALALARSILERGRFDARGRCRGLRGLAGAASPSTSATRVRAALQRSALGREPGQRLADAREPARGPRSQASVEEAVALARADSALTHPHPVCGDAVGRLRRGGSATRCARARGAQAAYEAARAWARGGTPSRAVRAALRAAAERRRRSATAAPRASC